MPVPSSRTSRSDGSARSKNRPKLNRPQRRRSRQARYRRPRLRPRAPPAAEAQGRDAVLRTSAPARVRIDTPSLQGSIALQGGRIDDLVLAKYRETVAPQSPQVVLFSPSGTPAPYYAEYGWVAGPGVGQPMPGDDTVWQLEKGSVLTPASPVTLVWDNGQGLIFRRTHRRR